MVEGNNKQTQKTRKHSTKIRNKIRRWKPGEIRRSLDDATSDDAKVMTLTSGAILNNFPVPECHDGHHTE